MLALQVWGGGGGATLLQLDPGSGGPLGPGFGPQLGGLALKLEEALATRLLRASPRVSWGGGGAAWVEESDWFVDVCVNVIMCMHVVSRACMCVHVHAITCTVACNQ